MESYIHTFPLLYIHCPTGPDFRLALCICQVQARGQKSVGKKKWNAKCGRNYAFQMAAQPWDFRTLDKVLDFIIRISAAGKLGLCWPLYYSIIFFKNFILFKLL